MSISRGMDKEDVMRTYSGILATRKNETGSFVEMWMDLETIIQGEVSQKEKNKYCILTHICGIQKNAMSHQESPEKWYR